MAVPFNELITTTLRNRKKEIADAIFNEFPLLEWLNKRGHIKEEQGGEKIYLPVEYAKNPTSGFYDGNDELNMDRNDIITMASYDWRFLAGTYQISGPDMVRNSGKHAFIKLTNSRRQNLITTLQDDLTTALFAASPGSKDFESLRDLIAIDPTTNPSRGNVGGVDRTTETYWRNKSNTDLPDSRTSTDSFGAEEFLRKYLRRMYRKCSKGPGVDAPDFILMDGDVFEVYETVTVDKLRYKPGDVADVSFTAFQYKKAALTYDDAMPSGYVYLLNTKYLYMFVHPQRNPMIEPLKKPVNQDVWSSQVLIAGNMVTSNPIRLGVINGFTT